MPDGIINREADNWRPLLAIADAAGGEWPERARKAAIAAHAAAAAGDEASRLEMLLGDTRTSFAARGIKVQDMFGGEQVIISSAKLVKTLIGLEGRPWAEMGKPPKPMTPNRLARMLSPLKIVPKQVGPEDARVRGYILADFEEAFERYLAPEGASQPSSRPACDEIRTSEISQPSSPETGWTVAKCEKPNNDGPLDTWTVAKGGSGEKAHMPTAKSRSDDLPYTGPVVVPPDTGPDPLDAHGRPRAAPDQGVVEAQEGTVASVPFMTTQEMKRRLRVCGYSDEQIARMTPQEAHDILGQLAPHPTNGSTDGGLTQQRRDELAARHRKWMADGVDPKDLEDDLRTIIREEVAKPELVEVEFERIMQVSRTRSGPSSQVIDRATS
jgi:hypothetical protein